jgi:hypothetical protein
MHGTCAAQGSAATKFSACHVQFVTDNPQQWGVGIGLRGDRFAIDFKGGAHGFSEYGLV